MTDAQRDALREFGRREITLLGRDSRWAVVEQFQRDRLVQLEWIGVRAARIRLTDKGRDALRQVTP